MNDEQDVTAPEPTPVLIVDDDAITIALLSKMLGDAGYKVVTAENGLEAIDILKKHQVHLVVTDWMMPEVNGPQLCRWIRTQGGGRYVFILMLTSIDDEEKVVEALEAGADEVIRKPIRASELRARLGSAQRMLDLISREVTIYALAELADSRDPETGDHIHRLSRYVATLSREVMARGLAGDVGEGFVELMSTTCPMHDIGKVGIPDSILLKQEHLNSPEFEIMKTHATIGANALNSAIEKFPAMSYLRIARDIALTHHERYDGSGYPTGLKGNAIPLAGRIVALCDAYDAITSKRVYKCAQPHPLASAEIVRSSGSHFDPEIVQAFLAVENDFIDILNSSSS